MDFPHFFDYDQVLHSPVWVIRREPRIWNNGWLPGSKMVVFCYPPVLLGM